jgi:hypothetical protein
MFMLQHVILISGKLVGNREKSLNAELEPGTQNAEGGRPKAECLTPDS